VVSANGSNNAIVWAIEDYLGTTSVLHAYNATNVSNELYNSNQVNTDAAGPVVRFAVPTVTNGKVYVGTQTAVAVYGLFSALPQAAIPIYSPPGGTYSAPVTVTMTDASPGTTIYYTTDGSVPNTSSTVYTAPIPVSGNVTFNALAVGGGYRYSPVTTSQYITGTGSSTFGFVQGNFTTPQSSLAKVTATYSQAQTAGDLNLVVVGWNDTLATIPSGGVTDSKGNVYTLAAARRPSTTRKTSRRPGPAPTWLRSRSTPPPPIPTSEFSSTRAPIPTALCRPAPAPAAVARIPRSPSPLRMPMN
jgi:hypothetical protein